MATEIKQQTYNGNTGNVLELRNAEPNETIECTMRYDGLKFKEKQGKFGTWALFFGNVVVNSLNGVAKNIEASIFFAGQKTERGAPVGEKVAQLREGAKFKLTTKLVKDKKGAFRIRYDLTADAKDATIALPEEYVATLSKIRAENKAKYDKPKPGEQKPALEEDAGGSLFDEETPAKVEPTFEEKLVTILVRKSQLADGSKKVATREQVEKFFNTQAKLAGIAVDAHVVDSLYAAYAKAME
jgi:hypothetical protein